MNDVLGIVVLYNPSLVVVDNIKSYSKYCKEIVAIDNSDAVDKKTINKIKEISNLKYISLNGNYGIAKALNIGCEYGINNKYKWVLTMDQDSYFSDNIIDTMFKDIKNNSKTAIISPNYFFDRKRNKVYNGYKNKNYTMQSGNLLNLDIYKKVGTFKENFFIDGVDYEYCLRLNKKGYEILECGEAVLYHSPAITKKILFFKYGYCNPIRIYYQTRNLLWISRKYNSIEMKLILLYKWLKILLFFDNKKEYFKMYKKGIKDCNDNNFGKIGE